jgi:phosphoribosylanthranilate isomerase
MTARETPAVKICGVTREEDAERAVELGARFLGLNFYPPSPRHLEVDRARRIAEAVRGRVELVGVFVNRELAEVEEIDRRVGLDLLQFHGDESPDYLAPVADRAIKAFRLGEEWTGEEIELFPKVWGFLLEARHATLFGGTGESWSYERARTVATERPVLLAGGVGPGNAREALERSGAWGLDVCSGVEESPGLKDRALLERLFWELRIAPGN